MNFKTWLEGRYVGLGLEFGILTVVVIQSCDRITILSR